MKSGYIAIILVIAGCIGFEALGQGVNPATWTVTDLTTTGSNVYYNPTSPVLNNSYLVYNYEVNITKIEARVLFAWVDVTTMVGGPFHYTGQDTDGLPATVLDATYGTSNFGGVWANVKIHVTADGYGHVSITNVSLGTTQGIRASGTATVTGISKPYLTTQLVGGEGTISPASSYQSYNSVVGLIATPEYGYRILRWEGSNNDTLKTRNNTVTMNGNRTVTAVLEPYIPGDLSNNGIVDMEDFALFAQQWMLGGCTDPGWCNGADIDQNRAVQTVDAVILAENWLATLAAAHWPLDGDATDASGYGHNGVVQGNPTWQPTGRAGGAIALDGVDDYVRIPGYKGMTGTASRTCMAWIKTDKVSGKILSWGTNLTGQKWIIRINENGTLRAEVQDGYLYGTKALTDNQWHHIAVVLSDDGSPNISEARLYVDGQLETAGGVLACAVNTAAVQDVQLGTSTVSPLYFKGLLDEVQIYSRALTDTEVMDFYQNP